MTTFIRWASSVSLMGAMAVPVALVAQDRDRDDRNRDRHERVYDRDRRDYHTWNANEDRAYHQWYNERYNGRDYRDYNRIERKDQRAYWNWRHKHLDNDRDRDDRH